jgi:hypothetical protein
MALALRDINRIVSIVIFFMGLSNLAGSTVRRWAGGHLTAIPEYMLNYRLGELVGFSAELSESSSRQSEALDS